MKDTELIDLIDLLREIPAAHWELFTFIRNMEQEDVERLKDLIQPKIPLPDQVEKAFQEEDKNQEQEMLTGEKETGETQPSIDIEQLRKFL